MVWLAGSGFAVEIGGGDFSGFDLLQFFFFSMGLILGDYSGF